MVQVEIGDGPGLGIAANCRAHRVTLTVRELRVDALDVGGAHALAGPEGPIHRVARHVILQLAPHERRALAGLTCRNSASADQTRCVQMLRSHVPQFVSQVCGVIAGLDKQEVCRQASASRLPE